jgi:hypothetical protein
MPLTEFQAKVAKLLSVNRTEESHLAGGAALNFEPNTIRYSQDLDYFNDTHEQVAIAFEKDKTTLEENGISCKVELSQPGYVRCTVSQGKAQTKIEWAHDSAWRFLPVLFNDDIGYYLHPIDLCINKVLTLAGRNEPRDFLDVQYCCETRLPLGALCWAACGKDPGFSPESLLALLRRRGRFQPDDFQRLNLNVEINQQELKQKWLSWLDEAEQFISRASPEDVGCLFYDKSRKLFVQPEESFDKNIVVPHFGKPGGVLPTVNGTPFE